MHFLLVLSALICISCSRSAPTDYFGYGQKNFLRHSDGDWTLLSVLNQTVFGKGSYRNGKPEGSWVLWDDYGKKIALLRFKKGKYHGNYSLYYSSLTPSIKADFKTKGQISHGNYSGKFARHLPNGETYVEYTVLDNQVTTVEKGLRIDANEQLKADTSLLKIYLEAITAAPHSSYVTY